MRQSCGNSNVAKRFLLLFMKIQHVEASHALCQAQANDGNEFPDRPQPPRQRTVVERQYRSVVVTLTSRSLALRDPLEQPRVVIIIGLAELLTVRPSPLVMIFYGALTLVS